MFAHLRVVLAKLSEEVVLQRHLAVLLDLMQAHSVQNRLDEPAVVGQHLYLVRPHIERHSFLLPNSLKKREILIGKQLLSQIIPTLDNHRHELPARQVTIGRATLNPGNLFLPRLL